MKTLDIGHGREALGGHLTLRRAAARRIANGKREVPELELEEVEIKSHQQ
ncbi:hypothetical protein [Bradyrhizobium tropiciagri]|nr:hypothetical protein [Bradyrhizobium tropiciagri]